MGSKLKEGRKEEGEGTEGLIPPTKFQKCEGLRVDEESNELLQLAQSSTPQACIQIDGLCRRDTNRQM